MEIIVEKLPGGMLKGADDQAVDKILKLPPGTGIRAEVKKIRNYKFHKKFYAMLNVGFEAFEPLETEYKGMPVQKSFERFRKDCIITAGYYDLVSDLKGNARAEAHSISFAKMDDDEFEKVYTAVCNVLLLRVLKNYTRDDLDMVVNNLLHF